MSSNRLKALEDQLEEMNKKYSEFSPEKSLESRIAIRTRRRNLIRRIRIERQKEIDSQAKEKMSV